MKGLRLARAETLPAAQTYLEQEYLPHWNQTFTVLPAGSTDAHRPLRAEHELTVDLKSGGRTDRDLRLHDSLSGEDLPDRAR